MPRILILDNLSQDGIDILQNAEGFDVDVMPPQSEDELIKIISEYDGLIIRSATTVTPAVIEVADRLRVIGRAGVGTDNIDSDAATKRGIVVMNTPFGNTISAAEQAIALMFSLARKTPGANAALKSGKWDKKSYTGVELSCKTMGLIGMGKIGSIVATVGRALSMRVLAYDPFLSAERAEDMGIELVDLDTLYADADFISLHTPKTEKTAGMINTEAFKKMKKTALLVNCARGGIVVEADLKDALENGEIAGAALDVFETEPTTESPLFALENIIVTPHLGASTKEAQTKVAVDIAKQFVQLFTNNNIQNAVNVSVKADPRVAPWQDLATELGRVVSQVIGSNANTITVTANGQEIHNDAKALGLAALAGTLNASSDIPVNVVNAQLVADQYGLKLITAECENSKNFKNSIVVKVETPEGETTIKGTLYDDGLPRIVAINDFDIDLIPTTNMLVMSYEDRPGIIGLLGSILGDADINIAGMVVGRKAKRGIALVVLSVDEVIPEQCINTFIEKINPSMVSAIHE